MPSFVLADTDYRMAEPANTILGRSSEKYLNVHISEVAKDDYEIKPVTLKAVDQKPAPGNLLAPGSKVIVFFEDTDSMMIDIFAEGHAGYAGKTAKDVVNMARDNEAVKKIIEAEKESGDLTADEKVTMGNFFMENVGLEIDEAVSTKNMESAYTVLLASYKLLM